MRTETILSDSKKRNSDENMDIEILFDRTEKEQKRKKKNKNDQQKKKFENQKNKEIKKNMNNFETKVL